MTWQIKPILTSREENRLVWTAVIPAAGAWRLDIGYGGAPTLARRYLSVNGLEQGIVMFPPSGDTPCTLSPVTLQLQAGECRIELKGDWCPVSVGTLALVPVADRAAPDLPFTLNNPAASPQARQVMRYLRSIHGKGVLTGQQTMTPVGEDVQYIERHTGELPAVRGFDLLGYSSATARPEMTALAVAEVANNLGSVEAAIRWWKERRGLVTFCWHWHSPLHGRDKAFYTNETAFDLDVALQPGTPEHVGVLKDMDIIAGELKRLRDEGVPVLWRPLHEAEGGWFWWGYKGPEAFKKLYRWMHERFTGQHGLNNLIWVWNAPAPGWYPGDDVVDLNAIDLYAAGNNYGPLTAGYDQTLALGGGCKPVALGENGPVPDMEELARSRTPWLWFLTWGRMGMDPKQTSVEHLKGVYAHPYAVTSRKLPGWLFES